MMGALITAMALLEGSRSRPTRKRSLLLSLLMGLTLTGCKSGWNLPNMVYLSVSTNSDQTIDEPLLQEYRERLKVLQTGYRQIHPSSYFQLGLYTEEEIFTALRRRNRAALGPDLLFVNGQTAKRLVSQGLADPFPMTAALAHQFNPDDLERMRTASGAVAGLPIMVQTQVACFNRKRLAKAPTTLQELLSASAQGQSIGLSIELDSLFWTAGSLGALDAIRQLEKGQALQPTAKSNLVNWMTWLQAASDQQRVTFYANQSSALSEFTAGRLDWIACSSVSLPRLRKALGASLGVASLPSGPGGMASPVNRLRVFALGNSSSRAGRERAIAFSRFTVNPLIQRNVTLGSQTVLPANRFVKVPVQSSVVLQALSNSQAAGQGSSDLVERFTQNDPKVVKAQNLITELVFGESTPVAAANGIAKLFQQKP